MTALRFGSGTDVGMVRQKNEDSFLLLEPLFAVADGMGGHAAGEVASSIAVEVLGDQWQEANTADNLADAVRAANRAVFERARADSSLRGMGTTLTAVALVDGGDEGEILAIVNVGDSRTYQLRDGELGQITDDHSVADELRRTGRLSASEAAVHPQRHVLTRVLGVDPDVEVDCYRVIPYTGDRYLLASDGLTNEVDDAEIASVLRRFADPDEAAAELVRRAKEHGGADNITVVIVDVVDDGDRAGKASAAVEPTGGRDPEPSMAATPRRRQQPPAPPAAAAAAAPATGDVTPTPKPRRLTLRVVFFTFLLLAVLAGAVAAVGAFARGSYYVGLTPDKHVAIFQGRPGGLLWFDPTLEETTELIEDQIPPARLADVRAGKQEPSLAEARQYVQNLRLQVNPTRGNLPADPGQTTTTFLDPRTTTSTSA